ncbi:MULTISPECIES: hypothetical protein [Actinomyces]|uniref:Uncharacterized protein n=2 Tax=Actinomyces TaxID=1654 RepID=A0A853EMS3_9ACTO|nr:MULTISPECIES: hypothetical protein [Actinomyces]MBF0698292.1 hypothetical protein [Actinomyces bowdenii]NYS70464.1 hypothetical protein [Actinomyces bowdenii]BDA64453.1 hypothetical protein MANAM107_12870 [Actinomyces capricornis]
MGESLIERMRRRAQQQGQASTASSIQYARDELGATVRTCPGCGAGRQEPYDLAECVYCGYVFVTAGRQEGDPGQSYRS